MFVRQETKSDYENVYNLIKIAFETAEHSDGNEHDLVNELRKGNSFIPELSLIAESEGHIAGHIMFTKAKVGNTEVLVLAPLSVSPDYQKQGVGTLLMEAGHNIAKELGYHYVIVLGSETYYPRVGYELAEKFGVQVPEGIPSANLMVLPLCSDAKPLQGTVNYAKEFGI